VSTADQPSNFNNTPYAGSGSGEYLVECSMLIKTTNAEIIQ
jgi:hypothetical protein